MDELLRGRCVLAFMYCAKVNFFFIPLMSVIELACFDYLKENGNSIQLSFVLFAS